MLVLVATSQTQGQRSDDYCWTIDGELVRLPFLECDCGDRCGCTRGFAGMTSHRATTTALVVDRPDVTPELLASLLDDELEVAWRAGGLEVDGDARDEIAEHVSVLVEVAEWAELGSVVERNQGLFTVRRAVTAP